MQIPIDYYAVVGFLLSIPFIIIMRGVYKGDTSVESPFFTIDTGRTMRFVFGYLVMLEVGVLGLTLSSIFLIFGLFMIIAVLIFIILNLLYAIVSLVVFIFTLGSVIYSVIGIQVFQFVVDNLYSTAMYRIIYDPSGLVPIFCLYTVAPIFSGYLVGKYVESRKAARLTELSWHLILLELTVLLVRYDPIKYNPGLYIALFVLHWMLSSLFINRAFAWKDKVKEYALPDVIRFRRIITLIFGFLGLGIIGGLFLGYLLDGLINSNIILTVQRILSIAPGVVAIVFAVLFFLRGDHPLDIRIEEIDAREDLLELAREFRELDPSKMDEFVRKGQNDSIRYV